MPTDFRQRAKGYLGDARGLLERIPVETLDRIFTILCDAYRNDRQVILMGNGGSAALASHFAVDLGKGTTEAGRRRFRVISIVDNTPVMTAYANDFSYADVFSEQIRTLAAPGDVVFGISGSGNSPNVLNGLKAARDAGATTIVLTGYKGGKAIDLADLTLVVPSDDMQHIEDCHLSLTHLFMQAMCEFVKDSPALQQIEQLQFLVPLQVAQRGCGDRLQLVHGFRKILGGLPSLLGDLIPSGRKYRFQQPRLIAEVLHQLRFAGTCQTCDGRGAGMLVPPVGEQRLGNPQNPVMCRTKRGGLHGLRKLKLHVLSILQQTRKKCNETLLTES